MSQRLDPRAYDREVVAPLRRARGVLPDDLLTRYAVDLSMTADELRARVKEVEALWNAKAGDPGPIGAVYQAFQQAHEDLLQQGDVRLDDPRWWRERAARRAADAGQEIGELAEEARQAYGPVGFVLPGQLADLGKRYRNLSEAEILSAVGQAGLAIIQPAELPQRSGLDPLMYGRLLSKLAEAGALTVAHLLHPGATPICLHQNPDGGSPALTRLDAEALERRARAAETEANSARSRAVTAALGMLRTAVAQGADLRQVAVFQILEKARETRAAGQPAVLTLKSLRELGVTEWDARVLTASLLAAEGARAAAASAEDIRRLVEAGQLSEARRVLAGLPLGDADAAALRELVAKAEAAVAELLAAARLALARGDEAEAAHCAAAARNLSADDPGIIAFADSLPPPPPQQLRIIADELGVKLSWQPSPGSSPAMRYRVVRREGRAPIEPGDGVVIVEGSATTVQDPAPPAARALSYAVFATTDRMTWSRAATGEIQVLPPVVGVTLRLAQGTARCTWRAHSDVARVIVAHELGAPPAGPARGRLVETVGSRFTDPGLAPKMTHCYAITAVYRGESGTEQQARTVVVTATAEEERKPVASLRAEPVPGDGALRARISWRQRDTDHVQVRSARSPCPWPFAAVVSRLDLQSYGTEVTGELSVTGGRAVLVSEMPSGRLFLTAFSLAGEHALVGQDVDVGFTAPIEAVVHERRGGELLLSWPWPARSSAAELRWTGADGPARHRITRGERARDDGWARIPAVTGPMRVEVRAIEVGPDGEATSGPRVVQVPGAESRLSYSISWKPVLPGATRRICEVRLLAPAGSGAVTVVAIAKPGIARPSSAADGQEVARWHGTLAAAGTALLAVTVPKPVRKPYWLCCFLAGGSGVLTDPPISHMRVG